MFEIVCETALIKRYQEELKKQIRKSLRDTNERDIGFPGGSVYAEVYSDSEQGLWCALEDETEWGRYWNPFGVGDPEETSHLSPIVEINIPFGINRSVGGVFLTDDYGNVYLGHRGKIGGGKVGVGKSLFFEKYTGRVIEASDGERQNKIAIISALQDINLIANIKRFVFDVQKIKAPDKIPDLMFDDENNARKGYSLLSEIEPSMEHAEVVNAFAKQLTIAGKVPFNTREIDVFTVADNGDYELVFEMKSKTDTQSVYTGIGQLFYHTSKYPQARKFLVLPKRFPEKYVNVLSDLSIEIISYIIKNGKIEFELEEKHENTFRQK